MVALSFRTENQINLDYQFFISSQSFKPRDSSRGFSFSYIKMLLVFPAHLKIIYN